MLVLLNLSSCMNLSLTTVIKKSKYFASTVRVKEWWGSKGPPIFGTAYATLVFLDASSASTWRWLLFLLLSLVAVGIYTNVINDLTDQYADHISGKPNRMYGRSRLFKLFMLCIGIAMGVFFSIFLIPFPWALALYVSMFIAFTAYSVRPLRLKQRGFFGPIADAVGARLLSHLFAVVLMIYSAGGTNRIDNHLLVVWIFWVGVWSGALGLRTIFRHQIIDMENDKRANINTFAVAASVGTLHKICKRFVFPLEMVSFLVVLYLIDKPLIWCSLVLYLSIEWLRYHCWKAGTVILMPIRRHRVFLMQYYGLFYPLAFLMLLVQQSPLNSVLLATHLCLFPHRLYLLSKDVWGLLRWIFKKTELKYD